MASRNRGITQINLNRKYGTPNEYRKYKEHLAKIREGSKPLTKEENNNLERKRKENQIKKEMNKQESIRNMEEFRKKEMNKGEIYKIETYEPAKKSLMQKLNISEKDLDFPDNFIPIFLKYIDEHKNNNNKNREIKTEMYEYTKIWTIKEGYDNQKYGIEQIPYNLMKFIWNFQERYNKL